MRVTRVKRYFRTPNVVLMLSAGGERNGERAQWNESARAGGAISVRQSRWSAGVSRPGERA